MARKLRSDGGARCCVLSAFLLLTVASFSKDLLAQTDFRVEVGEEEFVLGPGAAPMDNPMFSLQTSTGMLTFSANNNTYVYAQTGLQPLSAVPSVALKAGSRAMFDECGAWLQSASRLTVNSRSKNAAQYAGWYHAEEKCDYLNGVTLKSMAYAESVDGKTWKKPNYPYNRILTASADVINDPGRNSVGDGRVLRSGDFYYLFYWATDNWGVHLARSRVSDQGAPGTWLKYYQRAFSEPGIGGKSEPFNKSLLSTYVVYNNYLGRYIAIPVFGRWGFGLNQSDGLNLMSWRGFPEPSGQPTLYPPVSFGDDERVDRGYARSITDKQYYGYGSIVSPEGDSDTVGQTFYLYYVKLFDGESFDRRYQFRRKITLQKGSTSPYLAKVALSSYRNPKGQSVLSTEAPNPVDGYTFAGRAGYLLPYQQSSSFVSVYQCYDPTTSTYFLSTADPSVFNWRNCESSSDRFVRRVGYGSSSATQDTPLPLTRCIGNDGGYFNTMDTGCAGLRLEKTLVYVFDTGVSDSTAIR